MLIYYIQFDIKNEVYYKSKLHQLLLNNLTIDKIDKKNKSIIPVMLDFHENM